MLDIGLRNTVNCLAFNLNNNEEYNVRSYFEAFELRSSCFSAFTYFNVTM